ncbi:MAG TPA: methyltransferase domain-containing protein [Gaiellaceae bacterium]|nr:methyltransferase domain-containing protein [Gaiellaceae bacterium]
MTERTSDQTYSGGPAANYERYFVPAIGAPLARDLIELAALRPGEHVVDVACGTGVVARLAAKRVGDGGAVAGVDVNPGMLQAARNAAADTAIEWHEASAEALPLGDATCDVALCQMGLQFFPDRPGALREMRRVLRPGGRVVLNLPGPTPPPLAVLEQALQRHIGREAGSFVATVFSLHDTDETRTLLEDAGFTDVQARSECKTLRLPPAQDFLWQYVYSTPLADTASTLDKDARDGLQQEVATGWEPFAEDDGLVLELDMTSAIGHRT